MRRFVRALTYPEPVVDGAGLLETVLADLRARRAERCLPAECRAGRLLDIGCGRVPWFLLHSRAADRYGLDPAVRWVCEPSLHVEARAVTGATALPFADAFFDAVTLLAFVEHLAPTDVPGVLRDVHRVLKPHGCLILTTPTRWAAPVLRAFAVLGLISGHGLHEHQAAYRPAELRAAAESAGFRPQAVRIGYFQGPFNLWMVAHKTPQGASS